MDRTISALAQYGAGLQFANLTPAVVHECKRRLIDALGCGLAAFDADAVRIARELALRAEGVGGATVLGTGRRTLPELAAFANAVMVRYLDGNDCYPGGGGHPSDAIPAVLAAA
jgi:2-methylcitrate dehydratase